MSMETVTDAGIDVKRRNTLNERMCSVQAKQSKTLAQLRSAIREFIRLETVQAETLDTALQEFPDDPCFRGLLNWHPMPHGDLGALDRAVSHAITEARELKL